MPYYGLAASHNLESHANLRDSDRRMQYEVGQSSDVSSLDRQNDLVHQ